MSVYPDLEAKHARERAYFDKSAANASFGPLSTAVVSRYSSPGFLFPREFAFRLAGQLSGKDVLEVGCGEGANAVLLAHLGANVTALDISSGAIEVAKKAAATAGVTVNFMCTPLEEAEFGQFDIIWVEALLHHMLHDLDAVIIKLKRSLRPGGMIIMIEPINLAPLLRDYRLKYFRSPDATPDERPLERQEIQLLKRQFPGLGVRFFRALGRLDRVVLPDSQLEQAPWWRRYMLRGIAILDYLALSVPPVTPVASVAVLWATAAPSHIDPAISGGPGGSS